MTNHQTASQAIAAALGVSHIDARQSPLHAALAHAENTRHAEIVEQLLNHLGIDPNDALRMIQHTAPNHTTMDV